MRNCWPGCERWPDGPPTRKAVALRSGPFELDEATRRVTVGGRPVDLSQREFSILECLLRRPGQVLSRDQLLDYAWPYGVALTPNTVEAYIHLLREKVGKQCGGSHRDCPRRWLSPARGLTREIPEPLAPAASPEDRRRAGGPAAGRNGSEEDARILRRTRMRLIGRQRPRDDADSRHSRGFRLLDGVHCSRGGCTGSAQAGCRHSTGRIG